jgi:hypothetical protein
MGKRSDYLTVTEFAARVGVHPSTVRRWIHQGKIRALVLKCLYCPLVKTCKRAGKCDRVLHFIRWDGLNIGVTKLPERRSGE